LVGDRGEIHRLKYSVKTRNSEGRGRGGMEGVEGRKGVCGVGWGVGAWGGTDLGLKKAQITSARTKLFVTGKRDDAKLWKWLDEGQPVSPSLSFT